MFIKEEFFVGINQAPPATINYLSFSCQDDIYID
jgi:hypothetical protein